MNSIRAPDLLPHTPQGCVQVPPLPPPELLLLQLLLVRRRRRRDDKEEDRETEDAEGFSEFCGVPTEHLGLV